MACTIDLGLLTVDCCNIGLQGGISAIGIRRATVAPFDPTDPAAWAAEIAAETAYISPFVAMEMPAQEYATQDGMGRSLGTQVVTGKTWTLQGRMRFSCANAQWFQNIIQSGDWELYFTNGEVVFKAPIEVTFNQNDVVIPLERTGVIDVTLRAQWSTLQSITCVENMAPSVLLNCPE